MLAEVPQGADGMVLDYVGDAALTNQYGTVTVNFPVVNDTLYILRPKSYPYIKVIAVLVHGDKYGFMSCSANTTGGAWTERNYGVTNGNVNFKFKAAENKAETIDFAIYKMDL